MKGKKNRHRHSHEGVSSIDYYAYASGLRRLPAQFKMAWALFFLLFCIIADNMAVSVYIIVLMAAVTVGAGGIGWHDYLNLLKIPLTFILLGCAAVLAGVSFEPAGDYYVNLHWFYIYTAKEGIWDACNLVLKAFGAVSALYAMTLSTPAGEMIMVLQALHVPPLVTELMSMIYRYIFILMDVQCSMKHAAAARLGYVDFKTACCTFSGTAMNLLVLSLKKAGSYYDALEARCYNGRMCFLQEEKTLGRRHAACAVMAVVPVIILYTAA